MKKLLLIAAGIAFSTALYAGKANEVTLEGTGMCAKCELGIAEKCTNVLQVTGEDGKKISFTFAKNLDHGKYFCKAPTPGLVVKGTLKQEDGNMILMATSVEKKGG